MDEIIIALTTLPPDADVRQLARELVELGVAACVTVLPGVQSIYRWKGAVEEAAEQQLIVKSSRARVDALWAAIKARHPYDVPEFMVFTVTDGNPEYLEWIRTSTR